MEKMLFTSKQPKVRVVILPDGKRDITVLTSETKVSHESEYGDNSYEMFQYNGNRFRTIYPLTKEDIEADIEKFLEYSGENEPTLEEYLNTLKAIDNYTLQLINEGVIE